MNADSRERLKELLNEMKTLDYVQPEDIPNIDLYMDQVLTFLDQQLGNMNSSSDEKPMTKTMINNYSKNQILPPPEKKKYSRDHMLDLIFIYYLKNFMSMKDIKTILDPINETYFGGNKELGIYDIYKEMVGLESSASDTLVKDVIKKYNLSQETFSEVKEEDKKTLQDFAFICELSYDIFVKKKLLEAFISSKTDEN